MGNCSSGALGNYKLPLSNYQIKMPRSRSSGTPSAPAARGRRRLSEASETASSLVISPGRRRNSVTPIGRRDPVPPNYPGDVIPLNNNPVPAIENVPMQDVTPPGQRVINFLRSSEQEKGGKRTGPYGNSEGLHSQGKGSSGSMEGYIQSIQKQHERQRDLDENRQRQMAEEATVRQGQQQEANNLLLQQNIQTHEQQIQNDNRVAVLEQQLVEMKVQFEQTVQNIMHQNTINLKQELADQRQQFISNADNRQTNSSQVINQYPQELPPPKKTPPSSVSSVSASSES